MLWVSLSVYDWVIFWVSFYYIVVYLIFTSSNKDGWLGSYCIDLMMPNLYRVHSYNIVHCSHSVLIWEDVKYWRMD